MASVRNICKKAMVLENGSLSLLTDTESAIGFYFSSIDRNYQPLIDRRDRTGSGKLKFRGISFYDDKHHEVSEIISGDALTIVLDVETFEKIDYSSLFIGVTLLCDGQRVAAFFSDEMGFTFSSKPFRSITLTIPRFALRAGVYSININLSEGISQHRQIMDFIEHASTITVLPGDFWSTGTVNRSGILFLMEGAYNQN